MQPRTRKANFFSRNVRQMYPDAFPPAERMPFLAMPKLWHTDFLEFYDGDTLCGFVYPAHTRKLVFIMFLAVDKVLRLLKDRNTDTPRKHEERKIKP